MFNKLKIMLILAAIVIVNPAAIFAQTGRTEAFFKIFASGNYHLKAKITGGDGAGDMESYVKDNMTATTITAQGQTTRMISRDNKMYMIMDAMKMIMVMPAANNSSTGVIDTDGMKLTSSGTAVFNGKSLPYEEYRDAEGNKAQYFLDGNNLAGIRDIEDGGATVDIIIIVLDQNVPASVFTVPTTGYQVQEMPGF